MNHKPVFRNEPNFSEVQRYSDFRGAMRWLYENGIQCGTSTGYASLDPLYTVRAREWTLVTGIPSHGKSSFLDNVMVNMAIENRWRWGVFSAENLPVERHASRLAAMYSGKPFGAGIRTRMDEGAYQLAGLFLDDYFRFLFPPDEDRTVERILKIAKLIADTEGLQGLVIDPWNELDHSRPANISETEYVSRELTKIRTFARDHEVHVFLVAHPTKLQRVKSDLSSTEANIYPVPTPYDVSGSAHFRNKADNCLCIWRDVAQPHTATQIHVQKIRFSEVGQVGKCDLHYDAPTGQFIDSIGGARKPPKPITKQQLYGVVGVSAGREPGDEDE